MSALFNEHNLNLNKIKLLFVNSDTEKKHVIYTFKLCTIFKIIIIIKNNDRFPLQHVLFKVDGRDEKIMMYVHFMYDTRFILYEIFS